MLDQKKKKGKPIQSQTSQDMEKMGLWDLYQNSIKVSRTFTQYSISDKFRYTLEEDDSFYLAYFPPFYKDEKLYHFHSTDALLTFLMSGYDLKKIEVKNNNIFAALSLLDEKVLLFTFPETLFLRLIVGDEILEEEIEGYSTIAFYRAGRMRGFRVLEFEEINQLFVKWLEKYVYDLLGGVGRQESYTKSYII